MKGVLIIFQFFKPCVIACRIIVSLDTLGIVPHAMVPTKQKKRSGALSVSLSGTFTLRSQYFPLADVLPAVVGKNGLCTHQLVAIHYL